MAECESLVRDFKAALHLAPAWVQFGDGGWVHLSPGRFSVGPAGIVQGSWLIPWGSVIQVVPDSIKCELGYN